MDASGYFLSSIDAQQEVGDDSSEDQRILIENEDLSKNVELSLLIDMSSDHFDPLVALKVGEPMVKVLQDVLPLDFFSSCKVFLDFEKIYEENKINKDNEDQGDDGTELNEQDEKLERRKKQRKQCFSFESDKLEYKSPFQMLAENNSNYRILYNAWKDKERIKVRIRDIDGMVGICEGTLIAFDRHMNLILKDVEESLLSPKEWVMISRGHGNRNENTPEWIRKPSLKHPGRYFFYNTKTKSSQWNQPNNVKFKLIQRPIENYTKRYLPQLLIRGDMVIIISR